MTTMMYTPARTKYIPSYIPIDFSNQPELIGVSADLRTVLMRQQNALNHFLLPISTHQAEVNRRFKELSSEWYQDTLFKSSTADIINHPAYKAIISMGTEVIPLILKELEKRPTHWFWALQEITGENPVNPEHRGRFKLMAKSWLEWGRERGLV